MKRSKLRQLVLLVLIAVFVGLAMCSVWQLSIAIATSSDDRFGWIVATVAGVFGVIYAIVVLPQRIPPKG